MSLAHNHLHFPAADYLQGRFLKASNELIKWSRARPGPRRSLSHRRRCFAGGHEERLWFREKSLFVPAFVYSSGQPAGMSRASPRREGGRRARPQRAHGAGGGKGGAGHAVGGSSIHGVQKDTRMDVGRTDGGDASHLWMSSPARGLPDTAWDIYRGGRRGLGPVPARGYVETLTPKVCR